MHSTLKLRYARALAACLRGRYRDHLAIADEPLPGDPLGRLLWADVALYRGWTEPAAEALATVPPRLWPDMQRVLQAEVEIARGALDAAEELLEDARWPRSLLNRARVAYKRCDWHEAAERAEAAIESARAIDMPFYEGRALHIRATAFKEMGRHDEARADYERALELLAATEGGRFLAYTENDYGWLLADMGDLCGAEAYILAAYETAAAIGHEGDLGLYSLARLEIAHRAGRFAEVIAGAAPLAELLRSQRAVANEIFTLRIAAMAALALDRTQEGVASATAAARLAELERTDDLPLHQALELRALARAGRGKARDLKRLIPAVDAHKIPRWSALVRLWTVDAALTDDPELAAVIAGDYWPPADMRCWLLDAERHAVAAVRRLYRVTSEGEFYVSTLDPRNFPRPKEARHFVDLKIAAAARRHAGQDWGRRVTMAALLGVSDSRASSRAAELRRIAALEETRDEIAEHGEDVAEG